jgi:hypothetical protein
MRRLSMFPPSALALALAACRLVSTLFPATPGAAQSHVASRARIHVPADMHHASCARTGIAAGIGVAAIRPGAGAGWPALQRQHVDGEIEEVRDKKAC